MKTVVAILAAVVIAIPAVSQAQQCELLRMSDKLELTDQQIDQIQANALTQQKDMIQLRAKLQTAKLELKQIMMADKIDKAAALKKTDEISSIKAQMADKRLAGKIDRLNLLTDDQRAKARKYMRNGRGRGWDDGPGRGWHDGPGHGQWKHMGNNGDCPYGNEPGSMRGMGQGKDQSNRAPAPGN